MIYLRNVVSDLGHIPPQAAAVAAAVIVIHRIALREDIVNREIDRIRNLDLDHDHGHVLDPAPIHVPILEQDHVDEHILPLRTTLLKLFHFCILKQLSINRLCTFN